MKRTLLVGRRLERQVKAEGKRRERAERKLAKRLRRGAATLGVEVGARVEGSVR